jgi:anaerobic selenocysteine-containing dehydrogenase
VIRIGVAVERHAGGGQTVRALACLPALVGAWRNAGRRHPAAAAVGASR